MLAIIADSVVMEASQVNLCRIACMRTLSRRRQHHSLALALAGVSNDSSHSLIVPSASIALLNGPSPRFTSPSMRGHMAG